jgi:hypothetical protein
MAARKDQAQAIFLDMFVFPAGQIRSAMEALGNILERCIETGAPPHTIDCFEAAGRDEPCPWIGGQAIARPLFYCGRKGIVQRLLGKLEVAEQADQGSKDAARIGAIDRIDNLAYRADMVTDHSSLGGPSLDALIQRY